MIYGYVCGGLYQNGGVEKIAEAKSVLLGCGAERLYVEDWVENRKDSIFTRPKLDHLLAILEKRDVVMVVSLDTLACTTSHLRNIVSHIHEREAYLKVLGLSFVDSEFINNKAYDLITQIWSIERRGVSHKRSVPRDPNKQPRGNKAKPISDELREAVVRMRYQRKTYKAIEKELKIDPALINRILKEHEEKNVI